MSTRDNPYPFTFLREDILDLSDLNYNDGETWLYVSPSRTPETETFNMSLWLEESRRELRSYVMEKSSSVKKDYLVIPEIVANKSLLVPSTETSFAHGITSNPPAFAIGAETTYINGNKMEASYTSFRSMSPPSLVGSFMEQNMETSVGTDSLYFSGESKSTCDMTYVHSSNDLLTVNKTPPIITNAYSKGSINNLSSFISKDNTFVKRDQPRNELSPECLLNMTYTEFDCLSDISLSNSYPKASDISKEKNGNARRSVCLQKKMEAEMNLAARGGSVDSLDGISSESDVSASPVSPRPLNLDDVQERARLQEQSLISHVSTPVQNVVRSVLPEGSPILSPILKPSLNSSQASFTALDKLHLGNPQYWQPQTDRPNLLSRTLSRNSKVLDPNHTQNIFPKGGHTCESSKLISNTPNKTRNLNLGSNSASNLSSNATKEIYARKNLSAKLNALNATYEAEDKMRNNVQHSKSKISGVPPQSNMKRPTSRNSLRSSPSPPTMSASPSPPPMLPVKAQSAHCSPICSPHGSSQNLTSKIAQFQSQRDINKLGRPMSMLPQYGSEKQLYKRDSQLRSLRPPSATRSKLVTPVNYTQNIATDNQPIEYKTSEDPRLIKPIASRPSGLPQPTIRPSGLPRPRSAIPSRLPFGRTQQNNQNIPAHPSMSRRSNDEF